ncbi:DNA polymerase eta [Phymastichus coffea]|uniref:DNA polymerase eta n=1 Tax=Phymastichus coffea TaxID=108790 RepID=UPI00273B60E6|nr:DNA polymerase eta [Phymastichus coffea]
MANLGNRIIVLIDMDCFYCQVETRLKPEWAGKPLAVVQYNLWKGGGIIAVNYEARDFGVTRHMRGDEAKEKCPDINLAIVPALRGKADTSKYRSAGREVIAVLKKHCNLVERASIDEAYLDITQIIDDQLAQGMFENEDLQNELQNTYVVGYSENGVNNEEQRTKGIDCWLSLSSEDVQIQRLALAGAFVEKLRKDICEVTTFKCSAGISFNKILAKLACGLHKPNRQTILPASSVPELYGSLPVKKVRNLGGKFGDIVIDSLKCNVMVDLLPYSLQYLKNRFDEKTGLWLYNIARGIDNEPVTPRLVSKSIGACKRFPGKQAIVDIDTLKHWMNELSEEICERLEQDLEENERKASLMTVSYQYIQNNKIINQSKSYAISSYKTEKVAQQCLNIVVKQTQQQPIAFLGLSAGKFIKAKGSENFMNFFKANPSEKSTFSLSNQIDKVANESNNVDKGEDEIENADDEVNSEIVNNQKNHRHEQLHPHDEFETPYNEAAALQESKHRQNNTKIKTSFEKSPTKTMQSLDKMKNRKYEIIENTKKNNIREEIENSKKTKSPLNAVKANRKSSPCSKIHSTLKTDNFKQSFFMNILKEKQSQDDEIQDEEYEAPHEGSIDNVDICNDICNDTSNDSKKIEDNGNMEVEISIPKSQNQSLLPNNSMAPVKLQEIFPDLNDIDLEVVRLLPIDLRDEAKKWLKMEEVREKNSEPDKMKAIDIHKGFKKKSSKSKSIQQNSDIQHFFIKTDLINSSNTSMKKCTQCDQLILIDKFEEHNDYHVAQNIQKELNRLSNGNETRKRKVVLDSPKHIKKRLSDDFVN